MKDDFCNCFNKFILKDGMQQQIVKCEPTTFHLQSVCLVLVQGLLVSRVPLGFWAMQSHSPLCLVLCVPYQHRYFRITTSSQFLYILPLSFVGLEKPIKSKNDSRVSFMAHFLLYGLERFSYFQLKLSKTSEVLC